MGKKVHHSRPGSLGQNIAKFFDKKPDSQCSLQTVERLEHASTASLCPNGQPAGTASSEAQQGVVEQQTLLIQLQRAELEPARARARPVSSLQPNNVPLSQDFEDDFLCVSWMPSPALHAHRFKSLQKEAPLAKSHPSQAPSMLLPSATAGQLLAPAESRPSQTQDPSLAMPYERQSAHAPASVPELRQSITKRFGPRSSVKSCKRLGSEGLPRSAPEGLGSSHKVAGQKRKALLELLDEVEVLVQSGDLDKDGWTPGSTPGRMLGKENQHPHARSAVRSAARRSRCAALAVAEAACTPLPMSRPLSRLAASQQLREPADATPTPMNTSVATQRTAETHQSESMMATTDSACCEDACPELAAVTPVTHAPATAFNKPIDLLQDNDPASCTSDQLPQNSSGGLLPRRAAAQGRHRGTPHTKGMNSRAVAGGHSWSARTPVQSRLAALDDFLATLADDDIEQLLGGSTQVPPAHQAAGGAELAHPCPSSFSNRGNEHAQGNPWQCQQPSSQRPSSHGWISSGGQASSSRVQQAWHPWAGSASQPPPSAHQPAPRWVDSAARPAEPQHTASGRLQPACSSGPSSATATTHASSGSRCKAGGVCSPGLHGQPQAQTQPAPAGRCQQPPWQPSNQAAASCSTQPGATGAGSISGHGQADPVASWQVPSGQLPSCSTVQDRCSGSAAQRTAPAGPSGNSGMSERAQLRHKVVCVGDAGADERIVKVINEHTGEEVTVHLQSVWIDVPLQPGDSVNLIGDAVVEADGQRHLHVNMDQGMLVLHPDMLLSGTTITSAMQCRRQAWLQERLSGSSSGAALLGTMLHELLQRAMRLRMAGQLSREGLLQQAQSIVSGNTLRLLEVHADEAEMLKSMELQLDAIMTWIERYVRHTPHPQAAVDLMHNGKQEQHLVCVHDIEDIEENVWAPKFGLKGQLDATLNISAHPVQQGQQRGAFTRPSRPVRNMLAPFEFKTGKDFVTHRAQVSLYLLLMQQRYGAAPRSGLLWNLKQPTMAGVDWVPNQMASLMMHRNRLAAHLAPEVPVPPPMLHDDHQCRRCYAAPACAVVYKAVDRGDAESSGLGDAFHELTGHLSGSHLEFTRHWTEMVDLEEVSSRLNRSAIWAVTGAERERRGGCISSLSLDISSAAPATSGSAELDARFTYSFTRQAGSNAPALRAGGLVDLGFGPGDHALLSMEGKHPNMARCIIVSVSHSAVVVSLQKQLRVERFDATGSEQWRLDKDEVASTYTCLRSNVMALATNRSGLGHHLRRLIVDLEAPARQPLATQDAAAADEALVPSNPYLASVASSMNSGQVAVVEHVLRMWDYSLVLGMPGSGKTTTIVHAIRALVACGCSVLVTSYTNSAVDNIMLKLKDQSVPFLRLGSSGGVHQAVRSHIPGGEEFPDTSMAGLAALSSIQVVGCTCLSMNQPLLANRTFDVAIVDEAGQVTLPAVLGPLLAAQRFVLVGDPNQLPPLVQSARAQEGGLGESLFSRLAAAHPQAVVALREQYRMCEDVMLLSNSLVYNGQLVCGSPEVATASLQLTVSPQSLEPGLPDWMVKVLDPSCHVVLLDTDACGAMEQHSSDSVTNPGEARLALALVAALRRCGVAAGEIGVISPHRVQVSLMQRLLAADGHGAVESLTIDKAQGRDKAVMLLSFVRSNAAGEAGRLLEDWRRINVALTRAKCKLIMIGSPRTLASAPLLASMLQLLQQKGWLVQLPADCVTTLH